jgi:hypothetical protein
MSKVIFDIAISLDGFMADDNRSPQNPLGDGGMTIHNWMFNQMSEFRAVETLFNNF